VSTLLRIHSIYPLKPLYYTSLGGNGLITPGHVHVLGILRGARENQGKCGAPSEPTGNPHLDMKQQHQQER
jgi:hypothetical protein